MEIKTFRVSCAAIMNQCYLIYKDNKGILIDPAWDYKLISDFLNDEQIILTGILLTHSHIDHSNLAQEFAAKHGVSVFMSGIEIDKYNFNCLNLIRVAHLQQLMLGNFSIMVLLTPGHTDGSTCFLVEQHLFTGDTIFIEGVGVCELADIGKLYDSVQFLKRYLHRKTIFWPGHSFGQAPGKDLDFIMKNNIYFQLNDIKYFSDFRMRKNRPDPFLFR